jgi:hypothetical protein
MPSFVSGDDLAPSWAAETVAEVGEPAELSKAAKKKSLKRAREAEAAAPPATSSSSAAAPAPAASAAPKPGFRMRTAAPLCQASDSCSSQAAALWSAFRASPSGKALTPLEYSTELREGHVVRHGLGGAPPSPTLSDVVKVVLPHWGKLLGTRTAAAPRPRASPALLLLTHSAPRACELIKQLTPFNTRVAKLFARHLSLQEAAAALQAGPPCVLAVGTPHRVAALLEAGHLSLAHCTTVLLDTAPDVKGMSVLTMFGVRDELWALYWAHLHARVAIEEATKLALLE